MSASVKAIQDLKLEGSQMEMPVPQFHSVEQSKETYSIKPLPNKQLAKRRSSVPIKPFTPQVLSHLKKRTELMQIATKYTSTSQENLNQKSFEKKKQNSAKNGASSNKCDDLEAKLKKIMEENKRQKQEINELKLELQMSSDLQISNEELKRQMRDAAVKEDELNEEISELRKLNDDNYLENNNLKDRLKMMESEGSENIEKLKRNIESLKQKNKEEVSINAKLKANHLEDLKLKDEKLNLLKKQIAVSFKDNSWERQLQLDEMTKELKRVQEECNEYKRHLNQSTASSKSACKDCNVLVTKLDEKIQLVEVRDKQIKDLTMLMKKFQTHSSFEKELMGLVSTSKQYSDMLSSVKPTAANSKQNMLHTPPTK